MDDGYLFLSESILTEKRAGFEHNGKVEATGEVADPGIVNPTEYHKREIIIAFRYRRCFPNFCRTPG
ncbi:MAG: hypothetical protein ACOCXH_01635 [Cyclobacteriaceae bacterium]